MPAGLDHHRRGICRYRRSPRDLVGFAGDYLGILAHRHRTLISAGLTGLFYSLGGLSVLVTRKKWGAAFGMLFIGAEILGRVYLVATGIAPASGPMP